ncbi:hypothetical protein [Sorangium sp. So ce406]
MMDKLAERYSTCDVYIIWHSRNVHHGARREQFSALHGQRFRFVNMPPHA